jgi:hypothetical protein
MSEVIKKRAREEDQTFEQPTHVETPENLNDLVSKVKRRSEYLSTKKRKPDNGQK